MQSEPVLNDLLTRAHFFRHSPPPPSKVPWEGVKIVHPYVFLKVMLSRQKRLAR